MPDDDNGPTWNPEHLEVVKAGKDAIDKYRATGLGGERLKLTGAVLIGADLTGADLTGAIMPGADLTGADLTDANLTGAVLTGADLTDAILREADLTDAGLTFANLTGAVLPYADLTLAVLNSTDLTGAVLTGANLADANLRWANLRGAVLRSAKFGDADISHSHGARFDSHDLSTVKLHRADYPWLTLRRQYSGPMVLLHALILLLFFSPFIARGALHLAGTKMVEVAQAATEAEVRRVPEPPTVDLAQKLGLEPAPLWSVILQWDRSPLLALLVAVLVVYATLRFFLVWRVAPMREEEDRTGHTPPLEDYRPLIVPDRVVRVLFWVSLASTLWHAADWLQTSVLVER